MGSWSYYNKILVAEMRFFLVFSLFVFVLFLFFFNGDAGKLAKRSDGSVKGSNMCLPTDFH